MLITAQFSSTLSLVGEPRSPYILEMFGKTWYQKLSTNIRHRQVCFRSRRLETSLRLQVKLERTHCKKKKIDLKTKEVNWLIEKNPIHLHKIITHLQSGNQTYMELRNTRTTMGLRQQVQHSHHAEIPNRNSQSHSKCTVVCNKSYSIYRLQHPLRKRRRP